MIERNLGNFERAFRLVLGFMLLGWAWQQNALNPIDWFVVIIAVALILNGIFSRCYFWYLLDLNTCRGGESGCQPDPTCP